MTNPHPDGLDACPVCKGFGTVPCTPALRAALHSLLESPQKQQLPDEGRCPKCRGRVATTCSSEGTGHFIPLEPITRIAGPTCTVCGNHVPRESPLPQSPEGSRERLAALIDAADYADLPYVYSLEEARKLADYLLSRGGTGYE